MPDLRLALALPAAALALVAAGCGGDGKSAETTTAPTASSLQWAGGVCTALTTWKTSVEAAGKSIRTSPSKATLQTALDQTEAATKTMVSSIGALKAPQTNAATSAKKTVDTLSGQLQNDIVAIKKMIDNPSSAGGLKQAADNVATTLKTMKQQMQSAADDLRSLSKGELNQAFAQAPACAPLTGSSSSAS